MASTCAVATCKNNYKNSKARGITLHRFPKELNVQRAWVHLCKRKDSFNVQKAVLCSEHFDSNDYERDLQAELLNISSKKRLKKTAIPHLNIPQSSEKCATSLLNETDRKNRFEIRKRKQDISDLLNDSVEKNILIENVVNETSELGLSSNQYEHEVTLLTNENKNLKLTILVLEEQITALKEEIALLKSLSVQDKAYLNVYENIFTRGQVTYLKSGKCLNWDSEDIAKAVTLRSLSKKAFHYTTRVLNYPLPSERTIQRRLSVVKCQPGVIELSLRIMREQVPFFNDGEKDIILSFDEMKVQSTICYDNVDDCFIGPHTNVQVIMARSLMGKWKQPLFYDFDVPITKDLLINTIISVESIGFKVRGFVCDMGPSNRKLFSELLITPSKSYITNPTCDERKVWAFCDVPHLLKLLRNHLIDHGFVLPTGKLITKEVFEKLIELNYNRSDLQYCYKLSSSHVIISGSERQNVRKAAELLSETVSKAILHHFPEQSHVGEFVKTINDGFDVLNSRCGMNEKNMIKSGYGIDLQVQDEALEKLLNLCLQMRVMGKTALLPFQKGFHISIESLRGLFNDLKKTGIYF